MCVCVSYLFYLFTFLLSKRPSIRYRLFSSFLFSYFLYIVFVYFLVFFFLSWILILRIAQHKRWTFYFSLSLLLRVVFLQVKRAKNITEYNTDIPYTAFRFIISYSSSFPSLFLFSLTHSLSHSSSLHSFSSVTSFHSFLSNDPSLPAPFLSVPPGHLGPRKECYYCAY